MANGETAVAEQLQIMQTTDYDQFVVLDANREVSTPHVNRLIEAFREDPGSLRFNPVMVNENMEIIDGQHRLEAMKALGYPVYYLVARGTTISDTQKMNANQKNWVPRDYARSFARMGNPNYVKYLYFLDKYGLQHRTTLTYMKGTHPKGSEKNFRSGQFVSEDLDSVIEDRFQKLEEVGELTHHLDKTINYRNNRSFNLAYLSLLKNPKYNHEHFLHKLELFGSKYMRRFGAQYDYARALEQVYNERTPEEDQIRVF